MIVLEITSGTTLHPHEAHAIFSNDELFDELEVESGSFCLGFDRINRMQPHGR